MLIAYCLDLAELDKKEFNMAQLHARINAESNLLTNMIISFCLIKSACGNQGAL